MDDRDDARTADRGADQRRPRVLIAGAGERGLDALCAALERRGIEPVVIEGAIEPAVRAERPNLVLLVGDAARDDGARGIDDARRAGQTPVVVATDPEPLDRRLAPFQYGASGILVRRGDPDEMAGELQHLLGENARRIAERAGALEEPSAELDGLVGLGSRELRMSRTPHEGVSRREILVPRPERLVPRPADDPPEPSEARASVPSWSSDDDPTVERMLGPASTEGRATTPLPDWDEDLTTKRQASAEVARWRRLSASDRSLLRTPEMMAALEATQPAGGEPPASVEETADEGAERATATEPSPLELGGAATTARRKVPHVEIERALALAREERGDDWDGQTVKAPIAARAVAADDEALPASEDADAAARSDAVEPKPASSPPRTPRPLPPASIARPRRLSPLASAGAAEAPRDVRGPGEDLARPSGRPEVTPPEPAAAPASAPRAPSSGARASTSGPRTPTRAAAAAPAGGKTSATGERISSSALLALSVPARPPIEDRASTLRAQAIQRPRASVAPAMIGLTVLLLGVAGLAATRWMQRSAESDLGIEPALVPVATPPVAARPVPPPVPAPSVVVEPSPAAVEAPPPVEVPSAPTPAPDLADTAEPVADRERSDALVRDARALARSGDRAAVVATLEEAVRLDQDNPHAHVALARALLAAGDASDALAHAERAIALRRRRAEYHVVLGDARAASGDRAGAEASWRAALELEPEHAEARARLGE